MKKCWMLAFVLSLALWGCGNPEEFEQVLDVYEPQIAVAAQITLPLPEEAAMMTMGSENCGEIYFCDGYTLTVQTLAGGDLNRTLQTMTGFPADCLTVLKRAEGSVTRYECAWSCAGENGDQVGRLVLLDDGAYHYVVTVMADADDAGELTAVWTEVLDGVSLENIGT